MVSILIWVFGLILVALTVYFFWDMYSRRAESGVTRGKVKSDRRSIVVVTPSGVKLLDEKELVKKDPLTYNFYYKTLDYKNSGSDKEVPVSRIKVLNPGEVWETWIFKDVKNLKDAVLVEALKKETSRANYFESEYKKLQSRFDADLEKEKKRLADVSKIYRGKEKT